MNSQTFVQPSQRISVVDSLRGFAVVGIIIIHFLEHLNFYAFPDPTPFEQGLWDTVFYLGASKMYAIFSLLFGLSCYIMHHNQEKKGYDFRPRFAWRMVLLFLWGLLDLVFYNGDILVTYSVLGLLLIPFVKSPDKVLWTAAIILLLQPIELVYIVLGLIDPTTMPMDLGLGHLWGELFKPCATGTMLEVAQANLMYGLQINYGWAIEHGRLTQTLLLFIIGMMLGRKRLFIDEGDNLKVWKKVCMWSVVAFAVVQPLQLVVPEQITCPAVKQSVDILLTAWRNFAMTAFYVSGITLLYYKTSARKAIDHLKYIGKMSLSDYLIQSIVGAFLFYNWGLALYHTCSHGYSFLLAIVFLVVLYFICRFWTTHFRRGPLEELWYRATWLGKKNN